MELMVVIIILGLLAAFVLPNLTGKSDEAKDKLVCIQMKSIAQTLKMFKLDTSSYPKTDEGLKLLVEKKYLVKYTPQVDFILDWMNNLEKIEPLLRNLNDTENIVDWLYSKSKYF